MEPSEVGFDYDARLKHLLVLSSKGVVQATDDEMIGWATYLFCDKNMPYERVSDRSRGQRELKRIPPTKNTRFFLGAQRAGYGLVPRD